MPSAASFERPQRSIRTSASASADACTPQTKLLISFMRAPLPTGPRWTTSRPSTASSGRAASTVAASPPARNSSSPPAACTRLPVTGASRKRQPRSIAVSASRSVQAGESVLDSIRSAPGRAAASAPSGPIHTARDASSSATMLRMTSAPAAASRGVAARTAPSASSACARSGLRFQTVSGNPAPTSRRAMPPPITPKPRTATLVIFNTSHSHYHSVQP